MHILCVLLFIHAYKSISFKRDTQHIHLYCSGRKKEICLFRYRAEKQHLAGASHLPQLQYHQ